MSISNAILSLRCSFVKIYKHTYSILILTHKQLSTLLKVFQLLLGKISYYPLSNKVSSKLNVLSYDGATFFDTDMSERITFFFDLPLSNFVSTYKTLTSCYLCKQRRCHQNYTKSSIYLLVSQKFHKHRKNNIRLNISAVDDFSNVCLLLFFTSTFNTFLGSP